MATISKEEAFADLVREYENMWVAIIEKTAWNISLATAPLLLKRQTKRQTRATRRPCCLEFPHSIAGSSSALDHSLVYSGL